MTPSTTLSPITIPVGADFRAFYDQTGGERVFGAAITAPFQAETDGPLIQYFQTLRLDLVNGQVQVYPLGQWAIEGLTEQVPALLPPDSPSQNFASGFAVQDEFLTFYQTYHGERWLGDPISAQLNEGGLRVQYFVNGRLEWRPQLPADRRVQVSFLGQAHFDAEMVFTYRQRVLAQPVPSAGVTQVDLFAAVQAPIWYVGDSQVVFVTVFSPEGQPVSGVRVTMNMTHNGKSTLFEMGTTNDDGQIKVDLAMDTVTPGQDVVLSFIAYAESGKELGKTALSFKTWW